MNVAFLSRRTAAAGSICLSCRQSLMRQFRQQQQRQSLQLQDHVKYATQQSSAPFAQQRRRFLSGTAAAHMPPPPPPEPETTASGKTSSSTSTTTTPYTRYSLYPPSEPPMTMRPPPPPSPAEPLDPAHVTTTAAAESASESAQPASQAPAQMKEEEKSKESTAAAAATAASTTAAMPTGATPKPRARPSKLRSPRKAAMRLTPAAVDQVRALQEGPDPKLIKVGVRNRGCSGLAYDLAYVEKPGAFDELVEQDGVRVLVDSKALFSIIGSEMDWVEDKLNQRFVFRNPNIKEQCGCGESFMV